MKTPIFDFVDNYKRSATVRLHMPGHKGREYLGPEGYDITEITGADNLFSPRGIILDSENNATRLFGTAHTFYSTEGSTLAIKSMLGATLKFARKSSGRSLVLATRNAHKAFIHAAILLDFDVLWLGGIGEHICSSRVDTEELDRALSVNTVSAVYLTSPDYLGGVLNIKEISNVCKRHSVPLLVDNAHGAYLKFLKTDSHPINEGADMCCDSAHKTLPVLTGGAYLHVSEDSKLKGSYLESIRGFMSLFASTSPSYLILTSLDLCNRYLSSGYRERLDAACAKIKDVKSKISSLGYCVLDTEPLKIVIKANEYGYTGEDLANCLSRAGVESEFYDYEYVVFMLTTENNKADFERLVIELAKIKRLAPTSKEEQSFCLGERRLSVREAYFSKKETVPVEKSLGKICACVSVSCPPAIPIVVCGEQIDEKTIKLLKKYNVKEIEVVKNY